MSMAATTPALPLLHVKPLDGESGYLRWKESVMLRLHTIGLAHVLSEEEEEERPSGGEKQRARDDALCRGYILSTLSDRILPVYAHHATAGAVWRAVARTYDVDMVVNVSWSKASAFRYDEGKPLLEQLAHLEALTTVAHRDCLDSMMTHFICSSGFPSEVQREVKEHGSDVPMDEIWEAARWQVVKDRMLRIDYVHMDTLRDDPPPPINGGDGRASNPMNCARCRWRSVFDRVQACKVY